MRGGLPLIRPFAICYPTCLYLIRKIYFSLVQSTSVVSQFCGMKYDPLREKSYSFALEIIRLAQYLISERREFDMGRQLLRSGTGIGALICEAEFGQSRADFKSKMSIALKEANETAYWLCLLKDSFIINQNQFEELHPKCKELIAMLAATVKTLKMNNELQ